MTPRYHTITLSYHVDKFLKNSALLSNCLSNRRTKQGQPEHFPTYSYELRTGWCYDNRHRWVENTRKDDGSEICTKCGLED